MLPGAVIGATFAPGFTEDLSSWRLVIDDEGNLFQDIKVSTHENQWQGEQRQEYFFIGQDKVIQLLLTAEEVGFMSYKDSYDISVTDQALHVLSIRFGECEKTVTAYGAAWLAYEGDADMKGFLELWKAVHQYAPFPAK